MNAHEHRQRNAAEAENWLRQMGFEPSPLGIRACVLLALWEHGFHHIPAAKRVNWNDTHSVIGYAHGGLSTFDNSQLTRLVFLAHDECLRVELAAPETADAEGEPLTPDEDRPAGIRLIITARDRGGAVWGKHPALEEALAAFRSQFSAELAVAEESEVSA